MEENENKTNNEKSEENTINENKEDSGIMPKETNFTEKLKFAVKNDKISICLFISIYLLFFFFLTLVNSVRDDGESYFLFLYKFFFYFNAVMSIWCHLKCCLTNPGKITHELNPFYLEFYVQIRSEGIYRALAFQERFGAQFFSKMNDVDIDSAEFTDDDCTDYQAKTSIQPDSMVKISDNHKLKLTRCSRCYVVRVPGARHCSRCQGCILKMDHHCPWVFNCIGQFNQKFFIQFIVYSFLGILNTSIIAFYYIWYHDRS